MKQILLVLMVAVQAVLLQGAQADDNSSLRVMTFNIRYGTAPDGENAWPNRKELVLDAIREYDPHLLGLQECLRDQLLTILDEFPRYSTLGIGRNEDGGGEYSPLLYDRTRFDVIQAGTFWLSDTPEERGSKSWGNDITRICTWALLFDRSSGDRLRVFNTHWDHVSQPSRIKSGELICQRLESSSADKPIIVMGDFNVGPKNPARESLSAAGLRDSFVDVQPDGGQVGTFHRFTGKATSDKIDAILINKHWKTLDAEIVTAGKNDRFPSDHFPVTATLEIQDSSP